MKRYFLLSLFLLLFACVAMPPLASADSGHARIVRLSQVQGDVRFTRTYHDDPLTDANAVWEAAPLNLPIRQGNALSTGNGRAAVEFEDGAMAFLSANTVLEFYDLSLNDGSRITRLVLRQGSACFYDRSQNGDYFSVTGGDFTVEVTSRATFRLDNFDDGSTVNVQSGSVNVIKSEKSTPLEKGQSLSVHAKDLSNEVIAQAAPADDFDHWVSNQIKAEQAVLSQPPPSAEFGGYVSGYSDLYTYGSWMNVNGFNCWRPFGMGLGWSPFAYGSWYYDWGFGGWGFIGSAPWGWLPYHYGGWVFSPIYGWVWNPGLLFYGRPQLYRPVTAVFVHSGTTTGIVPLHPGDKSGKTPRNLTQGVYPVQGGTIGKPLAMASDEKWAVLKNSQNPGLVARPATVVSAPEHVARNISAPNVNTREAILGHGSSIVYDSYEHRFVNANQARVVQAPGASPTNDLKIVVKEAGSTTEAGIAKAATRVPSATAHNTILPATVHTSTPPRPPVAPAPARTSGRGSSTTSSPWGGGFPGSTRSTGSSTTSSPHPSGGGGRPH